MFKRLHHQHIQKILQAFNGSLLNEAQCYFGGGTAIVLALDEYRESVDIDFLCASTEGYRTLRNAVSTDLGKLLTAPVKHLREVRTDGYKIYTVLEIEGTPVKVEFVREGRVPLEGAFNTALNVPMLSRDDLYCQKLLANADRGLDTSVMSRDIIDLAMMIQGWGDIPEQAWNKAYTAYGNSLSSAFHKAVGLITDPAYLATCLRDMQMDAGLRSPILGALERASSRLPMGADAIREQQRRIEAIPHLQQYAGATYTLWRHATEALHLAPSPAAVDWAAIERKTFEESICEHRQTSSSVIAAIEEHSPGAVVRDRQAVIANVIENFAETWENRTGFAAQESPHPDFRPN